MTVLLLKHAIRRVEGRGLRHTRRYQGRRPHLREFSRHAAGVALVLVDHRHHPGPRRGDARPRARLDEAKTKFRDNWTKTKRATWTSYPPSFKLPADRGRRRAKRHRGRRAREGRSEPRAGINGGGRRGSVDTLLRLGQLCLDQASTLFQGSHLSFCRGDDVLRERCEQVLRLLVSVYRKHPMEVLRVEVLEHRIKRRTFEQQRLNRYANRRDNRLQLLRDAARIS